MLLMGCSKKLYNVLGGYKCYYIQNVIKVFTKKPIFLKFFCALLQMKGFCPLKPVDFLCTMSNAIIRNKKHAQKTALKCFKKNIEKF